VVLSRLSWGVGEKCGGHRTTL